MNSITDLLDLEDADIKICEIQIQSQTKNIFFEPIAVAYFYPSCGYRMHSRGTKIRKISIPTEERNTIRSVLTP